MPQFRGGTLTALKWAAVLAMIADHVDWLLLDGALGIHDSLGRLVFPIFGFVVAYNAARPGALLNGSHGRTLLRMLAIGVLATPVYAYLVGAWLPVNIMFTLALGVFVINLLAHEGEGVPIAAVLFLIGGLFVDYQWAGLAFMLAVWGAYARGWSPWWILAAAVSLWTINGNLVAVLALPLLWLASMLEVKMPRHQLAFYAVYPAHLVAIAAVLFVE